MGFVKGGSWTERVRPEGTDEPPSPSRRLGVGVAVGVAVLLVAVLFLIPRPDVEAERSRTEAVAVSESFIDALNNRDHETIRSLVSDSALISMNPVFSVDDFEMGIAWLAATGSVMNSSGCTVTRNPSASAADPVHLLCSVSLENESSRALGHDPDTRQPLTLDVDSGEIVSAFVGSGSLHNAAATSFEAWLLESHPDNWEQMFVYSDLPALTSESIALWGQYTEEFVADHRG